MSSTESEFYATTSGAIDTIYLKHIIEFLVDKPPIANVLTDNSASRQVACKLGTSRLRHINGRLLWIQSKVRDNILRMVQVGTLWNPADIGTKNLARDRHVMLLFMLGMVDNGIPVGETIYLAQKQNDFNKRSIRAIKGMFCHGESHAFPSRTSQQNMYAKQILRIAVAQTAIALSQAMDDEPNVEQLEHVVGKGLSTFTSGYFTVFILCFTVFATILIGICSVCFMMPEPEPESSYDGSESESETSRRRRYMFLPLEEASDPELWQELRHHDFSSDEEIEEPDTVQHTSQIGPDDRIPLRPNMVRCYALLSANFKRLKQLMMRDPRQRGRCFAVLYQLQQVFHAFEENRPNASNYSLLHQMMASICQMEEVAKIQVASSFEIDDVEAVVNDVDSELAMQAEVPTDSEMDSSLLYQGDMPEPSEPMSPESIAGWMVRRLSRRIYSAVVSGSKAFEAVFCDERNHAWNSACVSTF